MRKNNRKSSSTLKSIILQHVNNNLRGYTILIILFLIGIVARCNIYKQCK